MTWEYKDAHPSFGKEQASASLVPGDSGLAEHVGLKLHPSQSLPVGYYE
jgi:hypothetical protein